MSIQNTVEEMIKASTDKVEKNNLKLLKAEFQRASTKEVSDKYCIAVIEKLIKGQMDLLKYVKDEQDVAKNKAFTRLLESLLPAKPEVIQVSEEEILEWIKANIDFSQFKSKMAAMKPIMAHFGDSANGDAVKVLLNSM